LALGNFASRFLVAVVAVPIVLAILYVRHPAATVALVLAAALLAMREFFAMTIQEPRDRAASLGIGAAALLVLWLADHDAVRSVEAWRGGVGAYALQAGPLLAMVLAVVPTGLYYLFRFGDLQTVAARFAFTVTGIVYVGFGMTFLALCKRDFGPHGADVIVLVLLIAWTGDTGAYFAGKFLGKRKLYEAVSPKKTWAGAVGGLAGSVAGAAAIKLLRLDDVLSWTDVLLIAIPGGILGQLGDLAESLFKRAVGVKDSGSLLPGHGGMLDRIDAVLFIAPYVYLYLHLRPLLTAL
jgi:phosphatidate cytidylyltransferase